MLRMKSFAEDSVMIPEYRLQRQGLQYLYRAATFVRAGLPLKILSGSAMKPKNDMFT